MKFSPFWRLLALLAILLYLTLTFLIVRFIIHNLGLTILFGLTVASLLFTGWLLFGVSFDRARKLQWLFGALLLVLCIEVFYIVWRADSIRTLARFTTLTIAYFLIIAVLRNKYWSSKRQFLQQTAETASFKNPYLIMNPKSGNGRAMKAHIDKLAAEQGIKVIVLLKGDDIETIARKAVLEGADVLGVSGGDGSIGAVVKVAIEHKLPIVVLPGGTRCHFARDIGLDPERIADALNGFHGIERRIDVGIINGRYFLNNASFGLYADIIDQADYREHKVAVSRDIIHAITSGKKELYDLQFRAGGHIVHKALQVLIGVNQYDTINMLEFGHRGKLDDGILQITAITESNTKTMSQLMTNLRGRNVRGVYQWKATMFKITAKNKTIVAGVDGEKEAYTTPVVIRIKSKAIRVFVPPEGIRGRPKSQFGFPLVRQVWRAAVNNL